MTRVALTDGSGAWFNTGSAVLFKEDTRFDGRNQISVPTGSQWHHEWLYYTKGGKWVLNSFSNYQGTLETYEQIGEEQAVDWLVMNGHMNPESLEKLPETVRLAVHNAIQLAEI